MIGPSSPKLYNQLSPYYRFYSNKKKAYLNSVDRLIVKNITKKNLSMLDIGTGDGIRANKLSKELNTSKLTLIDNSEKMIDLSKKIKNAEVHMYDISSNNKFPSNQKFSLITSLWNVFGHIPTYKKRLQALRNIKRLLKKDGVVVIDISNRYNISYYGFEIVAQNIQRDIESPSIKNGDVITNIEVTKKVKLPYFCHFHNPFEFEQMIKKAGLKIRRQYYINYDTGKIEDNFLKGQLLYFLTK